MKPNIEDTDIIIRRVSNGWIVFSGSEYEADYFITTVHEEGETEWGEHEALIGLFQGHFNDYTQSKKRGGIKLEVREKGYSDEEDKKEFTETPLDDNGNPMIICDVCGRVVDEYEIISHSTLSGVAICAGTMKNSCKIRPYQGLEWKEFLNSDTTPDNVSEEDDER
jgi:hypothetical protein